VFKFFEMTDWPQDATNTSAPYVLGILGEDPFGEDLLNKFAQQKVNKGPVTRPVSIKRCSSTEEAKECHVVFISASEKERLAEILGALQDSSVLTIGETDGFARLGGIIGLTLGRDREKLFEVNKNSYKRSKLKIDSKVLACGKVLL